ncbi:MAG: hypothetical protein Q8R91_08105 [Candidatus Omnitrophota bacterium]|nr:hypothetical protein [Candidatus Omnitrophota bacterium]
MVPWPIALLTLFYGLIAALSAVMVWKVVAGMSERPLGWPLAWLVMSAGAMVGLPLLKPWARHLAIGTSLLLLGLTLAVAGALIVSGRPLGALLAACGAAVHVVVIRYVTQPRVKAWFASGTR